jgi:hypothetical protein
LCYQFARKGESGFAGKLLHFSFLQALLPLYGVFVVNSPPIWLPLTLVSALAWKQRALSLHGWQLAFLLAVYCSAAFGGELWYVGWFTPFGYLLLSLWFQSSLQRKPMALCFGGALSFVVQLSRLHEWGKPFHRCKV